MTSSYVQIALQSHESRKLNFVAPEKSKDFSYAIKKGVRLLEEKKKYKKKNDFKINVFFNEKGEALEKIVERAFGNYCLKTVKK